jgi:hypothetical protein
VQARDRAVHDPFRDELEIGDGRERSRVEH